MEVAYNFILGLAVCSLLLGGTILLAQLGKGFYSQLKIASKEGWLDRSLAVILVFALLLPFFLWGFFSLYE